MVVFVVKDKIGGFRLGLDESFGVKPFREFNVPIFSRVNKSIDSLVQKGWGSKVFSIFREVICILKWKSDKVATNDFGL